MSDPFSLIAGIVGVATTGFKIAQGLHRVANGIGSAGEEVRMFADEIDGLSKLFTRVHSEVLDEKDDPIIGDTNLIRDILDICERITVPLTRLQDTLERLLVKFEQSPGKLHLFGQGVKWAFSRKKKLLFYREALAKQSELLNKNLTILILLKVSRKDIGQPMKLLQESLKTSIAARDRPYCMNERLLETSDDTTTCMHPQDASSVDLSFGSQALVLVNDTSEDHDDSSNDEEFRNMECQLDKDLELDPGDSVDELSDEIRVLSRKTFRWAVETLRKTAELAHPSDALVIRPKSGKDDSSGKQATFPESNSIIFEDDQAERFEIPLDEIPDWEGMFRVLREMYEKRLEKAHAEFGKVCELVDGADADASINKAEERMNSLEQNKFCLKGRDGQVLSPRYWSRHVKSNPIVGLLFYEDALNGNLEKRLTNGPAVSEEARREVEMKNQAAQLRIEEGRLTLEYLKAGKRPITHLRYFDEDSLEAALEKRERKLEKKAKEAELEAREADLEAKIRRLKMIKWWNGVASPLLPRVVVGIVFLGFVFYVVVRNGWALHH